MTDAHTEQDVSTVLIALIDEVRGLREDVRVERRGRRLTQNLAVIVSATVLIFGASYIADLRATAERSCTDRVVVREDIRDMGVALTAYVTEEAGVDPTRAAEIIKGAEQITVKTLPPPDC